MGDIKRGLENVVALETRLSYIDGLNGKLEYRGYNINELAKTNYETVAYLLLNGELLDLEKISDFSRKLREERDIDNEIMNIIKRYAKVTNAIDVLRTSISILAHRNKNDVIDYASSLEDGIKIIAKLPTMVASYYRYKRGLKPIEPDEKMGHAENFLYMLRGHRPTTLEARVMDIDLILSAEHGLNASTFVARIAASTLSDIYSAIIAAISTLAGPLHGGARERVMEMIERIRYPENAELYILDLLEKKERIMGFGHRVYKTIDPRARIYKEYTRLLAEEKGDLTWYNIAEAIERIVLEELVVKRNKPIYPNVDFYPSVVYKYLGIPKALATAIFAIGRVSGWVAHYLEQISSNRLIRPRAKYIGPHDLKLNLEAVKKSI